MQVSRAVAALMALLVVLDACTGSSNPTPTASPTIAPSPSGPASEEPPTMPGPSLDPSASEEPSPVAGTEHTVRSGESLTGIARMYGTTLAQLQEWNATRYPSIDTNP